MVGHGRIAQRLWAAAAGGTLHHALLFEGPPGVGKHTLALHLAAAANCEVAPPSAGAAHSPCGGCASCNAILSGRHPDILQVSPPPELASGSIPVESIREVNRQVGYHRYAARERFVLLDPAEAMAAPAANALLKTLEEPPAGTRFILITTTAGALLPTIRSRCQQIRLGPIEEGVLATWLAARGVPNPDLLARHADGCPGRALNLAEGGLEEKRELRDQVLAALAGDLTTLMGASQTLSEGRRGGRAAAAVDALEDLVRDAVIAASGSEVRIRWSDRPELAAAWGAALWPGGVTALSNALSAAREQLAVNVPGRLVLDALFTVAATELGSARKAAIPG